jgi:hypothetical protein
MSSHIYKISNIKNNSNKLYIGKTINLKNRISHHKKTYGCDIKLEVLETIDSHKSKDWKPLEVKWINFYRNLGYDLFNKNEGGNGCDRHTVETKKKISESKLGNKYNFGNKYNKQQRENIVRGKTGTKYSTSKTGKDHGNYGKVRTEEQLENYRISYLNRPQFTPTQCLNISKGKIGKGLKPISQYSLDGVFIRDWVSLTEAGECLKRNKSCISAAITGQQKTAFGFIWKYKK